MQNYYSYDNTNEMMFNPNLDYIRNFNPGYDLNFNQNLNQRFTQNNFEFNNMNNVINKNNFLKTQYPKIYDDINNIISEIIPNYRNTSMGIDIVEEMVDKIYESYISLQDDKEEKINLDIRKTNEKIKQDKNINENNSKIIEKRKDNDILRDLIKILLITRLIKFNLDNTNMHNNTYQKYNYNPYNFEMRSGSIGNDAEQIYMGYRPRNYF